MMIVLFKDRRISVCPWKLFLSKTSYNGCNVLRGHFESQPENPIGLSIRVIFQFWLHPTDKAHHLTHQLLNYSTSVPAGNPHNDDLCSWVICFFVWRMFGNQESRNQPVFFEALWKNKKSRMFQKNTYKLGGGFKDFVCFTPVWGRMSSLTKMFLKRVEWHHHLVNI